MLLGHTRHEPLDFGSFVQAHDTSTLFSEVISIDGHNYDVIFLEKQLRLTDLGGTEEPEVKVLYLEDIIEKMGSAAVLAVNARRGGCPIVPRATSPNSGGSLPRRHWLSGSVRLKCSQCRQVLGSPPR